MQKKTNFPNSAKKVPLIKLLSYCKIAFNNVIVFNMTKLFF